MHQVLRNSTATNELPTPHGYADIMHVGLTVGFENEEAANRKVEREFVKGTYEFHHYGQSLNDHGWGCAYR